MMKGRASSCSTSSAGPAPPVGTPTIRSRLAIRNQVRWKQWLPLLWLAGWSLSGCTRTDLSGRLAGDVIDEQGGFTRSADGRVTLQVPPAALEAPTLLWLEPTDWPGTGVVPGSAFELGPAGVRFARQVQLSFTAAPEWLVDIDEAGLRPVELTADGRPTPLLPWANEPRSGAVRGAGVYALAPACTTAAECAAGWECRRGTCRLPAALSCLIQVVFAVQYTPGLQDGSCAALARDPAFRPGAMWLAGRIHETDALQLTTARREEYNGLLRHVELRDDGRPPDLAAGDRIWTTAMVLPVGLRLSYQYAAGPADQPEAATAEWPDGPRLFEVRDRNDDGWAIRFDRYGDEASNKSKPNRHPRSDGSLDWGEDLDGDGCPETSECVTGARLPDGRTLTSLPPLATCQACADAAAGEESVVCLSLFVDDTANQVLDEGADLRWHGNFRYNAPDGLWQPDPAGLRLFDDGPDQHEMPGATAGDHIWTAMLKLTHINSNRWLDFDVRLNGVQIWDCTQAILPVSAFNYCDPATPGALSPCQPEARGEVKVRPQDRGLIIPAGGLQLPAHGPIDLKLVLDPADLEAGWPQPPDQVRVQGSSWAWQSIPCEPTDQGRWSCVLSDHVGPGTDWPYFGLLRCGTVTQFAFLLGAAGTEYTRTAGVSAFYKTAAGEDWIQTGVFQAQDSRLSCATAPCP